MDSTALETYLQSLLPPADPTLAAIEAETRQARLPIIGPLEGQFLSVLLQAAGVRTVLEIGTAAGYSTIWLARAVQPRGGRVTTIERELDRAAWAQQNFQRTGLAGSITLLQGEAFALLPTLGQRYDAVFVDILRSLDGPAAAERLFALCLDRLAPGGLLIADNALHGQQVLSGPTTGSAGAVATWNRLASQHPALLFTLVPLRDGIAIAYRRE